MGKLEEKMRLTFRVFDCDNDGKISREDIKFIMGHIPYIRHN